jgi:small subunit ribosomal protein S17
MAEKKKNEETPETTEETPETVQDEVEAAASGDAPEAEAPDASGDDAAETPEAAAEEAPAEAADDSAAAEDDAAAAGDEPAAAADDAAAAGDEPAAAADDASGEAAEGDAAPAAKPKASKSGPTRREKLDAKRAERQAAAGKRPSRTPEERDAERRERRAALAKQRRAYRQKLKAKKAETRTAAPAAEELHAPEHGPGRPKVRQGVVVSDKGEKTITVRIDVVKRHKRYHKILRSSVKLHAHDERNDAHEGDTVRVVECRPMSRSKRWRLDEVLERAK